MTNKAEESILVARYGSATRELTDLVIAAEKAYNHYGKKSIFGKDKGRESDEQLTRVVMRAVSKLTDIGMLTSNDLNMQIDGLKLAMRQTQAAYSNWPKAYRYLDNWLDEFVKPVDMTPVVAEWIEESRLLRSRGGES
jgi:hypothetical protein